MKVFFFQTRDENLSINLLFDTIRKSLPESLHFSIVYFNYNGASLVKRIFDIVAIAFRSNDNINHVIGDFNYATFFMPKSKTILTIHDLFRLYVHKASPFKVFIFKWFWLRIPILKSAVVTAVSQSTKDEILKYANCAPEKIRVIYNCISSEFKPAPKIFNKDKPVLLQVGTRANKNLERLIKAIEGINCRLDIVGNPSGDIIELLDYCKIEYTWKSNLTNKEIIKKYIDCDLLVFVSTFEGFGMPIIEANVVERAVVTSNVSAMPEIAGDAACLVNPFNIASIRNGIIRVIEDEDYRNGLIEAGRENKKRFEAKNIADKYYNLYQEVYWNNKKA